MFNVNLGNANPKGSAATSGLAKKEKRKETPKVTLMINSLQVFTHVTVKLRKSHWHDIQF